MTRDPIEHEVKIALASGAELTILYFSDREMRWIFAYDYFGERHLRPAPEIVNKTRLTANYEAGLLAAQLVLSMHVVVPDRLGKQYFAGVDISPGAKTYLEFTYERQEKEYRLVEICKGARDRLRLADLDPALVRPIEFAFPVPDRVAVDFGMLRVPFRANDGNIHYFELPARTLRNA
ncbi:MAG TPA: hypothetical protein VLE97_06425 [Gaiellaceae bacterium]|nr:hypothetical protein [Gaiellaceae bacterium]